MTSMCCDGQYAAFSVNMHISKNYILFPIKSTQITHNSKKITSQKLNNKKTTFSRKYLFWSTKWEVNSSIWSDSWSGQVKVFNVHIQSKLLKRTPVTGTGTDLRWFFCPGHMARFLEGRHFFIQSRLKEKMHCDWSRLPRYFIG